MIQKDKHNYHLRQNTSPNSLNKLVQLMAQFNIDKFLFFLLSFHFYPIHLSSAFHEAIGDAIALSVQTPRHLQTLGLVQKSVDDTAHDINYLFALALDKV